ncbi:hypothetical protein ARMSODRAFT_1088300 [Armillaria solidipes]|uniref:Uncharacterized protein n=1 Tax=Armillaria solidipes TaxID=1076256 RepID=A0A2H3BD40_9AGAR|nr:hypothetical protein ARMSODRAFT_1088300 [Armillaria solidipes]
MSIYPANIQEFLTFLPVRPPLLPEAKYSSLIAAYTAQDVPSPEDRLLCCHPDLTLIPRLMEFLIATVKNLDIGSVSCQSTERTFERMHRTESFQTQFQMGVYVRDCVFAIDPIMNAIAQAAGLSDPNILVNRDSVGEVGGDFDITILRKGCWEPVVVCSEEDIAYSVLLEQAEDLSRPFSLDLTKKQTGAKAIIMKLALQMATAKAEYGFLFAGYIAISAQLVRSTDPSRPGRILLLSPVFKLQNESLPYYSSSLTQFQANIPTEPFLAIIVAMLCANLLPGHSVGSPPISSLEVMSDTETDADADEDEECVGGDEEIAGGTSDIPTFDLQVETNAMILQHPYLRSSDIHRISIHRNGENIPATSNEDSSRPSLHRESIVHLCRCAPHIPSTNVGTVTLVERISESRWSTVWRCRVDDDEKLRIIKFVPEVHSTMILRELYMYEVALKGCSLVPKFYGVFYRPVGGWFGFLLEDVGENLEKVH